MKIKSKLILLLIILITHSNSYSQYLPEIKYTLNQKFDDIELNKIIDLIENFKNNEIEILTLEMEKLGRKDRFINEKKIYFGSTYHKTYGNIGTRHLYSQPPQYRIGDLYFSKTQSPKLNDRFKVYNSLTIYISKENLYNSIIEIGNKDNYKILSSKIINGGVLKQFEFIPIDKTKGFIIQTWDGDEISKITFMLSY
jgi:hypothetical protein